MEPYCLCSLWKILWFWFEEYCYWAFEAEKEVYIDSDKKS